MIVEYIRYRVSESELERFLAAYRDAAQELQASPHCLGYEVTRCAEQPSEHVVRILWDSAEGHLKGFRGSTIFASFLKKVQPFYSSIQEMRHYTLTDIAWLRARTEGAA